MGPTNMSYAVQENSTVKVGEDLNSCKIFTYDDVSIAMRFAIPANNDLLQDLR